MIPEIDFKKDYPEVTIRENFAIQDEFTLRLEVFVPDGVEIKDAEKLGWDASYYMNYFSGHLVGHERRDGGTLYLVNAWKD